VPEADSGLLYHYTSEAGLRGIIENDSIWATDIHFLNDWTEFSHVFNEETLGPFVESFLEALPPDIDKDARQVTLDRVLSKRNFPRLLSIIEGLPPYGKPKEAFVCSFTADAIADGNPGDRLSQWRGYLHSSQGFSLGFDRTVLKQQIETQNSPDATAGLVKCIYDDEEKLSLFVNMGRAAATEFIAFRGSGEVVPKWFRTNHPNPSDEYIRMKLNRAWWTTAAFSRCTSVPKKIVAPNTRWNAPIRRRYCEPPCPFRKC
jgi:hypothetical protein